MEQILGTAEPLPLASLNAMRRHFPTGEDNFDVKVVVESMGSLLSGTTNPDSPIRPLHASFRDFLTNERYSGEFFIDVSKAERNLAFASLRVMEHGLRFNICDLKSSYLPNSKDPGLQERVQKYIPPHLSYSSRFWMSHVRTTVFDKELAKEVCSWFNSEQPLFWIELLALINALSGAVPALRLISQWLKVSTLLQSADKGLMRNHRDIRNSRMSRRLQWTCRDSFKSSAPSFYTAHHIYMYQHSHSRLPTLRYPKSFLHGFQIFFMWHLDVA
jgi:hypothetical protein